MRGEVYWIKLMTNTFDCETMMLIESLPEGDTIIIIWIRMQILAGKCNASGFLLLGNDKPYTDEMLATVFRRPLNTTRLAIATFREFGMVEIINETYFLPEWELIQNISGLDKIREQTRLRVSQHRAKKKGVTPPVTQRNDSETDKKLETELDKNTTNNVREMLTETPLSTITDQELSSIAKQHGIDKLILVADICAEMWRRKPKKIDNPAGYLISLCGPSLSIPKWYKPYNERLDQAKAAQQRKADAEAKENILNMLKEEKTAVINSFWNSLSQYKQKKYQAAVIAKSPEFDLPEVAIMEMSKLLAWEASNMLLKNN